MKLLVDQIVVSQAGMKAMDESVKKWEKNASDPRAGLYGVQSCALCTLYLRDPSGTYTCTTCPLKLASGSETCNGTPYELIPQRLYHFSMRLYHFSMNDDLLQATVNDELQFIKDVRAICVLEEDVK